MAHKIQHQPEPVRPITDDAVLTEIQNGAISIWNLGAAFNVPSYQLHDTVTGLVAAGRVIQDRPGLYTARLTVAEPADPPSSDADQPA